MKTKKKIKKEAKKAGVALMKDKSKPTFNLFEELCSAVKDMQKRNQDIIQVDIDGWSEPMESKLPKDKCSWIDISVLDKNGDKLMVHFYFTQNSTRLDDMIVYHAKKLEGFDDDTQISK